MKRIDAADIDIFEQLTAAALNETDSSACIGHLLKRAIISGHLAGFSTVLDKELSERLYSREIQVIDRLEQERTKLLCEIDKCSHERCALKTYNAQFLLPSHSSFFDKND